MGNSVFSRDEIAYLYSLPAVERVTHGRITYSEQFKRECMRQYAMGESPAKVFREAGLGSELVGYKRIERCIARWKKRYPMDMFRGAAERRHRGDVVSDAAGAVGTSNTANAGCNCHGGGVMVQAFLRS